MPAARWRRGRRRSRTLSASSRTCVKCVTTRHALCPSLLHASADRTCVSISALLARGHETSDCSPGLSTRRTSSPCLPQRPVERVACLFFGKDSICGHRVAMHFRGKPATYGAWCRSNQSSRQAITQPTSESLSVARQELPLHDAVDAHLTWLGCSPDLERLTTESGGL